MSSLFAAVSFGAAAPGFAAPVTNPTGLMAGTQYRLAFVTSTTRDAASANIADYNAFVTGVANSSPDLLALGTTWSAIGSTTTVDARDNTNTNPTASSGTSIYLLNDTILATNNADLWDGAIANALGVTEQGSALGAGVWTGTISDGTAAAGEALGDIGPFTVFGASLSPFAGWIDGGLAKPPTTQLSLYAISGVLTAVPEPGSALLIAMGLAGFGWRRGRVRRS